MHEIVNTWSRVLGWHSWLVSYHKARLRSASEAMRRFGTGTAMPVGCSRRFRHHQQALKKLGFVVDREFELRQRPIPGPEAYRAFCARLRSRFPDGDWSCVANGPRVVVTVPRTQWVEWQRFLLEYDQAA